MKVRKSYSSGSQIFLFQSFEFFQTANFGRIAFGYKPKGVCSNSDGQSWAILPGFRKYVAFRPDSSNRSLGAMGATSRLVPGFMARSDIRCCNCSIETAASPSAICPVDFIITSRGFVRPAFIPMGNHAHRPWTISERNHARRPIDQARSRIASERPLIGTWASATRGPRLPQEFFRRRRRVEHPLLAEKVLTLSFSEGWPILAGLLYARVGLPHFAFPISISSPPTFPHISTAVANPSLPAQLPQASQLPPTSFESAPPVRMSTK